MPRYRYAAVLFLIILFCTLSVQPAFAKKFKIHPLLMSVVVPGSGQLSLNHNYGYGMLTGEVLAWSSYLYSSNEQKLKGRESYEYALKFAHINPGSYNESYYTDLTKFMSSGYDAGGYNASIRQEALSHLEWSVEMQQEYIDAHAIPEDKSWSWDSSQDRKRFSTIRKDILVLQDQAQVITGIIIANHILSTIDMLRLKKQWHNFDASFRYQHHTAMLNLRLKF